MSVVGRAARDLVPPAALAFWRWTFALLLLLPLAWPHLKRDWPVLRANWAIVALLGALAIGSFNILLYTGLQSTTALNSMLIQSALPALVLVVGAVVMGDRSEEHTSELQSLMRISYAVFCLKKKNKYIKSRS